MKNSFNPNPNYLGRNYKKNYIKTIKKKSGEKYFTKEDIFISRMASIIKKPHKVVKDMFSERTVTAIRLNNLIADTNNIKKKLESSGLILEKVAWAEDTYIVTNFDKSELGKSFEYKNGLFYIQNLSSLLPALSVDWKSLQKIVNPLKILDMCASPGGKTLQIASLAKTFLKKTPELVANEVDFYRYKKMIDVFTQFSGKYPISTTNFDGGLFGLRNKDKYDLVFLDAPCSGEGQIYLAGEKPLRSWSLKRIKFMTTLQKALIKSAFSTLKKGGTMIYSTCTLEPEENEGILKYLLESFPKNCELEKINLVNRIEFSDYRVNVKAGLTSWNNKTYPDAVLNSIRVLPSARMMGFFVAKIKKV